jgi:hypothetical protein
MKEKTIVDKGNEIINFISSKYNIVSYYSEYFTQPNKILKIVFNYQFYILYDFDKKTLLEIDYDENVIDITNSFINYYK